MASPDKRQGDDSPAMPASDYHQQNFKSNMTCFLNSLENFFVLGPNGVKESTTESQETQGPKSKYRGVNVIHSPVSNFQKNKTFDSKQILDSLLHLKTHQECKPFSSILRQSLRKRSRGDALNQLPHLLALIRTPEMRTTAPPISQWLGKPLMISP